MPPFTSARTRCRFGSNRRGVMLWAWLMLRPTTGPFPQISQRFAMVSCQIRSRLHGHAQLADGSRRPRFESRIRRRHGRSNCIDQPLLRSRPNCRFPRVSRRCTLDVDTASARRSQICDRLRIIERQSRQKLRAFPARSHRNTSCISRVRRPDWRASPAPGITALSDRLGGHVTRADILGEETLMERPYLRRARRRRSTSGISWRHRWSGSIFAPPI